MFRVYVAYVIGGLLVSLLFGIILNTKPIEQYDEELTDLVDFMAERVHTNGHPDDMQQVINEKTKSALYTVRRQRELEHKIVSSFPGAPESQRIPSLGNPNVR
eukprot:PhM_4_TR5319/c0_g1_i2/m.81919